ncbi:hypothetical protein AMTRI_Chr03g52140 [Amborella trichopoda]
MVSSMATFPLLFSFLFSLLLILSLSSTQSSSLQSTGMASTTQILSMPSPSTHPFRKIRLGSSLSTTPAGNNQSYWLSPSGNFAFGFYPLSNPQHFMIGVWMTRTPEKTLIWTANRDDPPRRNGTSIILTSGQLLLRNRGIQEKPITNNSISATSAAIFDNGNFVLYRHTQVIWQSFDMPTDTIVSGQRLLNGYELLSSYSDTIFSSGKFRLKMQKDGNLVLYPINTNDTADNAYWATGTNGQGNNLTLNLDSDGHLYLMNSSGYSARNISESKDSSLMYRMTLSSEGKLELYSHGLEKNGSLNSSIIWSAVEASCAVKGICGVNSYCFLKELRYPSCRCAPGFSAPGPERTFLDCARSFTDGECENGKYNFTIQSIENIIWEGPEYHNDIVTEDDCKETCLDNCTCMAALFDSQKCAIMKSPLRYGKRTSDSVKAFFRVPYKVTTNSSSSILPENPPPHPPCLSGNSTDSVKERDLDRPFNKWFPISLALGSGLVFSLALSGFLAYRPRMGRYYRISSNRSLKKQVNLRSFSYGELYEATRGFAEALEKGTFGTVFKGSLCNDDEVAVKKLDRLEEEGEKEFRTEMNVSGRTHHKNLVQLFGFCDEGSHRLLVYEFMSNGSLAKLLFNEEKRPNWEGRVKMALDIARGLLYLHEECVTQIIHCDIKPQNILLDEFQTAKISNFELAELLEPDQTSTSTGARGTRGYVAPEWFRNVPVTAKVDVYSYGAMLLEIICCRNGLMVDGPEDELILSDWVYKCFQDGCLEKLIAPNELQVGEEKKSLERMIMVGVWCIQEEPALRPSMKTVVLMLEGTVEVEVPPHP